MRIYRNAISSFIEVVVIGIRRLLVSCRHRTEWANALQLTIGVVIVFHAFIAQLEVAGFHSIKPVGHPKGKTGCIKLVVCVKRVLITCNKLVIVDAEMSEQTE